VENIKISETQTRKSYRLSKDPGFYGALYIGLITTFVLFYVIFGLSGGEKMTLWILLFDIIPLLVWIGWIRYFQGKKLSFIVGFFLWFVILTLGNNLILGILPV